MKLHSIEVEGFRRFATRQTLHVDCRTIALLGPNESGKTSLLRLLQRLNDEAAFAKAGASQDLSRGKFYKADHVVLTAKFLIEDEDLELPEVSKRPQWFVVEKLVNGSLRYSLSPLLGDHLSLRSTALQLFDLLFPSASSPSAGFIKAMRRQLSPTAKVDSATLTNLLSSVAGAKEFIEFNEEHRNTFSDTISMIINLESESENLINRLKNKIPLFILFAEDDRNLSSSFDLAVYFAKKGAEPIPRSLKNLADSTDVNLGDLLFAMQANDSGRVETIISAANDILKDRMSAWSQSRIEVRLTTSGTRLNVVAGRVGGFESLSERSDGLRQFVALSTFLSLRVSVDRDVILLLDEAETHLHYDAQADLIQMLNKQCLAKKVIYSTHSLACLPEDLGLGVRFVKPIEDDSTSVIVNKFWTEGTAGLSPILFGMGAATMAFLPVRYCVFVEGISDVILLPSLLREANEIDHLNFQISPGLAEAGRDQFALMKNEGSRILYLVDGDEAGGKIAGRLLASGVSAGKIIKLDQIVGHSCVIEDFVDKDLYIDALNQEFDRLGLTNRIALEDIGDNCWPASADIWAASQGAGKISKVNVAYALIDRMRQGRLLLAKRDSLRSLYSAIRDEFLKDSLP